MGHLKIGFHIRDLLLHKLEFTDLLAGEALAVLYTFANATAFLLAPHLGATTVEIGEVEEVLTDNAPLALQGALWELDQDIATFATDETRLVATLAAVVLSDTGGYIAGVLFGRHPMAPAVSPKKSWEGLAGSLIFGFVQTFGAVLLPTLSSVLIYALLAAVLVIRPEGLLPAKG